MKRITLTLLLLVALPVWSDDIIFGEFTKHFEKCQHYNEPKEVQEKYQFSKPIPTTCTTFKNTQPLIGYGRKGYTLLLMPENSFGRPSIVVLKTNKLFIDKNTTAFASYGVATGYTEQEAPIIAGLALVGYVGFDIHPSSDAYGLILSCSVSFCGVGGRVSF